MQMLLISVPPNSVESLLISAEHVDDVLHAQGIQARLILDEVRYALAHIFQNHATLNAAINPEHILSTHGMEGGKVSYNTAVQVAQIYESLNAMEDTDIKALYKPRSMHQAQLPLMDWGIDPEQDLRRLKVAFNQLQSFYFDAAEHNLAVIRVVGERLFATEVL
jgi:hypothetical protein